MKRFVPFPVLLLILGLFAGCASSQVERGRSLAGVQRFFVLDNANDNHALNKHIVAGLIAHGHQAETGPLTMMPDETQAIVTYQDHWTWDFGDHLVYLQISMRDRKTSQPYGSVTFSATVPTHKPPARIVADLLAKILPAKS